MRKIALVTAVVGIAGAFGFAAPAFAGPGQCYDYYGRPVGPVYDTDNPNYGLINSVLARGGHCTGVVSPYTPGPGNSYYYRQGPRRDYQPRQNWRERRRQERHRYDDQKPNIPQNRYEITR